MKKPSKKFSELRFESTSIIADGNENANSDRVSEEQEPDVEVGDSLKKSNITEVDDYNLYSSIIVDSYMGNMTYYSITLDLIALYLKGQKLLYVESKQFCEQCLHTLMLPAIFISATCTVLSMALKPYSYGAVLVSTLTGLNSFILAVVTYLKLDAKAEAHKTSAYQFDKLQTLCEFYSGKTLMLKDDLMKEKVTKFIEIVEQKDLKKEIKEKYPKINLVEFAISNTEGEHTFNQVVGDDISAGTSSLIDRADDWYEKTKTNKIIVNTIRGEKLLEIIKEEIDVCKIDVEGFTYEVLESFDKKLSNIKSLHVECEHKEVWKTQKLYEEIKDFLNKKNFVEVYFSFTSEHKLQSDSIWVYKDYLKI